MRGLTGDIGLADVEFYEAEIVMKIARILAKKDWDSIGLIRQQRFLNQAVQIAQALINDQNIRKRFHEHYLMNDSNHSE